MNIVNSLFLMAADAGNVAEIVGQLFDVVKIILTIVGIWYTFSGFVSVADGQREDNPNAKTRGYREVASGVGIIIVAWIGVPKIVDFVKEQITSSGASGGTSALLLPFTNKIPFEQIFGR